MQNFSIPSDRPWIKTYANHGLDINVKVPDGVNSLLDSFEHNFAKHGNKIALTCMGVSISYRELDTYSRQIASYLQSLGLVKGDKVAGVVPKIF